MQKKGPTKMGGARVHPLNMKTANRLRRMQPEIETIRVRAKDQNAWGVVAALDKVDAEIDNAVEELRLVTIGFAPGVKKPEPRKLTHNQAYGR